MPNHSYIMSSPLDCMCSLSDFIQLLAPSAVGLLLWQTDRSEQLRARLNLQSAIPEPRTTVHEPNWGIEGCNLHCDCTGMLVWRSSLCRCLSINRKEATIFGVCPHICKGNSLLYYRLGCMFVFLFVSYALFQT